MIITMIFQCKPIKRVWNSTIKGECIDVTTVSMVMGSMNVLTDFFVLCLPLPELWKLQMRRRTKFQLIGIFSIGGLFVTPPSSFHLLTVAMMTELRIVLIHSQ